MPELHYIYVTLGHAAKVHQELHKCVRTDDIGSANSNCEFEQQGWSNDRLALEATSRRVGSCSPGAQAYVRAIVPCLDVAWNDSLAALSMSCPSYVSLLTLE
ncbi:hypothetical protein MRX96_027050 [Rhipicephalus microplus]